MRISEFSEPPPEYIISFSITFGLTRKFAENPKSKRETALNNKVQMQVKRT